MHYNLENGHVYPFHTANSVMELKYRCKNNNYKLKGEGWLFCIDGKWSNPPPVCELNETKI